MKSLLMFHTDKTLNFLYFLTKNKTNNPYCPKFIWQLKIPKIIINNQMSNPFLISNQIHVKILIIVIKKTNQTFITIL